MPPRSWTPRARPTPRSLRGVGPEQRAPALGVRFALESRGIEPVILEKRLPGEPPPEPTTRPAHVESIKMPVYDRFKAVKTAPFPAAYVLPAPRKRPPLRAAAQARGHRRAADGGGEATPNSSRHRRWTSPPAPFRAAFVTRWMAHSTLHARAHLGDFVIRTAQPLGILAFNMLEPESWDGVVAWGELAAPAVGQPCSILKVMTPLEVKSVRAD